MVWKQKVHAHVPTKKVKAVLACGLRGDEIRSFAITKWPRCFRPGFVLDLPRDASHMPFDDALAPGPRQRADYTAATTFFRGEDARGSRTPVAEYPSRRLRIFLVVRGSQEG